MKKVTLKKISLYNFRGVSCEVSLNVQGITKISARNKVGKSSIQNAWNWLLTGYTDSVYPKNHELFDRTKPITPETETTKVIAELSIDGTEYTIGRHAKPKFTNKNGEYEKDKTDSYKYVIDGISVGAVEYNSWVSSLICKSDMLKYCLDGSFFSTLAEDDKDTARKVLETLIGNVEDEDFKTKYEEIYSYLSKGYSVEQIKKRYKDTISEIEKSLKNLQSQIEVKRDIVDEYNLIDYDAIKKMIEDKEKSISEIDNEILHNSESVKPIVERRDFILKLIDEESSRLLEEERGYNNVFMNEKAEIESKINEINARNLSVIRHNDDFEKQQERKKMQLKNDETRLEYLSSERETLLKKKDEIKARVFNSDDTKCPLCGNELPYEEIEEKRAKFYQKNNEELSKVVKRGKEVRSEMDILVQSIKQQKIEIEIGFCKEEIESTRELQDKLDEKVLNFVPFKETEEYKKGSLRIDKIRESMPEISNSDTSSLVEKKKEYMAELGALNRKYGCKEKVEELEEEIENVSVKVRESANEKASLEGKLHKLEEFVDERANSISMRVNGMMKDTMIVMYRKQKDGTMVSDCVVCDTDGIKFSTINTSNRILIKMELQRLFCEKCGVQLPIFVDEYKLFDDYNAPKPKSGEQMIVMFPSNSPILEIE